MGSVSDDFCSGEFPKFIGASYEESMTECDYTYFMPTQASWDGSADREVLCVAVDIEGDATGTLQGIKG